MSRVIQNILCLSLHNALNNGFLLILMDMLIDELDKQFPNALFNISCIDNLEELDSVFYI